MKLLIQGKADVMAKNGKNWDPLYTYINGGRMVDENVLELFIDNKVDLNIFCGEEKVTSFEALLTKDGISFKMVNHILSLIENEKEDNYDKNIKSKVNMNNPLFSICSSRNVNEKIEIIDLLLSKELVDVNEKNKMTGMDILETLCSNQKSSVDAVKCILKHKKKCVDDGYNYNNENKILDRSMALLCCSRTRCDDQLEKMKILVSEGAPLKIGNNQNIFDNANCLYNLCKNGIENLACYKYLIEDLDVNIFGKEYLEHLLKILFEVGFYDSFNEKRHEIIKYMLERVRFDEIMLGQNGNVIFSIYFEAMVVQNRNDYQIYELVFEKIPENFNFIISQKTFEMIKIYCEVSKVDKRVLKFFFERMGIEKNHFLGDDNNKNLSDIVLRFCSNESAKIDCLSYLIEKGAEINVYDDKHRSPLHILCNNIRIDKKMLFFLMNNLKVSTSIDNKKRTAFHYACRNARIDLSMFELFVDRGFDCFCVDQKGRTPFEYAMKNSFSSFEIFKYIFDRKEFHLAPNTNDKTNFLHHICKNRIFNQKESFDELLALIDEKSYRTYVNSADICGRTPIRTLIYTYKENDFIDASLIESFLERGGVDLLTLDGDAKPLIHVLSESNMFNLNRENKMFEFFKDNKEDLGECTPLFYILYNVSWSSEDMKEIMDCGAIITNPIIFLNGITKEKFFVLLCRNEYVFDTSSLLYNPEGDDCCLLGNYNENKLWSIETHHFFPRETQDKIELILLIFKRLILHKKIRIPKFIFYKIIAMCYPEKSKTSRKIRLEKREY